MRSYSCMDWDHDWCESRWCTCDCHQDDEDFEERDYGWGASGWEDDE